jgi:SAM-dependent methyltransferase
MSKHQVLTKDEVLKYRIEEDVINSIEEFRKNENIAKEELAILDWGCGRGRAVAKFREMGYRSFGVDIDEMPIKNSENFFSSIGLCSEELLKVLNSNNISPFPNESFHVIYSEQVFEHIENMDAVAKEMYRIMKKGGIGIHHYPAKWVIKEGHLFQPFIHWFPKNRLRFLAILFFTILGLEPNWSNSKNLSAIKKAEIYYQYSIHKTFYRSVKEIKKTFVKTGFSIRFTAIENSKIFSKKNLLFLTRNQFTRRILCFILNTFIRHDIRITKK